MDSENNKYTRWFGIPRKMEFYIEGEPLTAGE